MVSPKFDNLLTFLQPKVSRNELNRVVLVGFTFVHWTQRFSHHVTLVHGSDPNELESIVVGVKN